MTTFLTVAVGFAVLAVYLSLRNKAPKPPGPRPWPVLGNLLDMPREKEWITFREWGKRWGDIVSISIFGNTIVILNTIREAVEMLDGKGALYSDRPYVPMIELTGWDNSVGLGPYGTERYRETKRLFHQLLGTNAALTQFHSVKEQEMLKFMKRLLSSPEKFSEHINTTASAIILRIAYGYSVQELDDPFVKTSEEAMAQISEAATPGNFLVNIVPALNLLPEWVPGTGFKRQARIWAQTLTDMIERPYRHVKAQIRSGKAEASVTSRLLEAYGGINLDVDAKTEFYIQWVGGTMVAGGTATMVVTLHAFLLALLLHPDIQRKAQDELDSIVGSDRLPVCTDRDNLPYVHALALEVMRWHTTVPSGVPHSSMEDTVYKGYRIPKGSIIIPNVWGMAHDPAVYHEPMSFKPERFLPAPGYNVEPDPRSIIYGFGRRICAGRLMADMTIFLSCATILAVFDVTPHLENGVPILPKVEQLPGTISNTPVFKCTIKPRSKAAASLIN